MSNTIYTPTKKDHSEKPLKLMIKKHMRVGIKYLCKTVKEDHNAYSGSGTRWIKVLKKHGREHVRTKVIFTTHSKSEFKRVGLLLSEQWDIVNSDDWANLIPEGGEGSVTGSKRTKETKANMSAAQKGRKHSEETKARMSAAQKGKKRSEETLANMSAAQKGKKLSEETRARMSSSRKGKKFTEEHKAALSSAHKGKKKKPMTEEQKARASVKKQKRDSNGRFIKKETT